MNDIWSTSEKCIEVALGFCQDQEGGAMTRKEIIRYAIAVLVLAAVVVVLNWPIKPQTMTIKVDLPPPASAKP
jgi:hypothetical protein